MVTNGLWMVLSLALAVSLAAGQHAAGGRSSSGASLWPELAAYAGARATEFDRIGPERRELLDQLAAFVRDRAGAREPIPMTFICTHNSRRSHMAQLWTAVGAELFGVPGVRTYSGGTEATAFNPRAVAALERAGFDIAPTTADDNPIYHVRLGQTLPPLTCFSKVYDQAPNPSEGFVAVMVCGQADESCPYVEGASFRLALPFEDPKASDGSSREASTYDERCAQIAREMLYVMSRAAAN